MVRWLWVLMVVVLVGCGGSVATSTPNIAATGRALAALAQPTATLPGVNPSPIDFESVTGQQWSVLPASTKTAALQWYIAEYGQNMIGACANPTPAALIPIADRYASMAQWRDETMDTVMTIALVQSKCLR